MHGVPHASGFAALRTDQHHVGDVNRRLALDDAELRIDVAGAALVLLHQIDACHQHAIAFNLALAGLAALAPPGPNHAVHLALAAAVVARDDQNFVALTNIHTALPQ